MDDSTVEGNWTDCLTALLSETVKASLGTIFMRQSIHLFNLNYRNGAATEKSAKRLPELVPMQFSSAGAP